jgi:hypothetical protein
MNKKDNEKDRGFQNEEVFISEFSIDRLFLFMLFFLSDSLKG